MVCKIISGKDIRGALNYNEQKVMEGKATLIQANGFLKESEALSFYEKLNRFTDLHTLNRRTKTNTLHVSLNFDTSENLDRETLGQIASAYMTWIGFGDQPYLVYQHHDAAHQHVHIVATLIRNNGKRIPIHYLGKNASEKARKEIEKEYGLVQAEAAKAKLSINPELGGELAKPNLQKAIYGKLETKRSISNIVRTITRNYKYTSLAELNAVLRLYNVTADRGSEGSQMYAKKGLIYSLIEENENRIGIPIKASSIAGKPTLKYLEKQFTLNEALRQPLKDSVKKKIEHALAHTLISTKEQFRKTLNENNVEVIYRTNAEGRTYGITFVDHTTKAVFNGSDLGKTYGANTMLERLANKPEPSEIAKPSGQVYLGSKPKLSRKEFSEFYEPRIKNIPNQDPLKDLLKSEDRGLGVPESAMLHRKRRRKRRKI